MGAFRKNNQKLELDDTGTELDWILANSRNQLFFYDAAQSVKPSDINEGNFNHLLDHAETLKLELNSQMRVQGGRDYIQFVDELLHVKRKSELKFAAQSYELLVFDSLTDLYSELGKREEEHGLSRLVAGYSWPWLSKEDDSAIDIKIENLEFQWNRTDKDWINSPNAFQEIGCIHTVQGYDLNYTGIIFGKEITYNKATNSIEIIKELYFDQNGKKGIRKFEDLKAYIINIYKTIMYRGIKGTFVYACNPDLNEYLKQNMASYGDLLPFRIIPFNEVKPYVNAVPLVDITAAAGGFSDLQIHSDYEWMELPFNVVLNRAVLFVR